MMSSVPKVSVLGLGPMGAALAFSLRAGGHEVVVWNRTPMRARSLAADGFTVAGTAAEAVAASPLTVMCVRDAVAAQSVLDAPGVSEVIAGRVFVQMTTMGVDECTAHAEWLAARGARFVMGCVSAYADAVGKSDAFYLYAGNRSAYDEYSGLLSGFGGKSHWVGDDPRSVPAAFSAYGTFALGSLVLFLESAAFARQSGIPIDEYAELCRSSTALILNRINAWSTRISEARFDDDEASVETTLAAMDAFLGDFRRVGLRATMAQACFDHLAYLNRRGDGGRDLSYLAEALWMDREGTRV